MKQPALLLTLIIVPVVLFSWTYLSKTPTHVPEINPSEIFPGGDTTVSIKPAASFMLPAANLPAHKQPDFYAGKALAHQPWIKAPATTNARDGLGPLFNARTCLSCHFNGGRGLMPENNQQLLFTNFLRLSIPGKDAVKGVIAEPTYGDQLQSQSTSINQIFKDKIALQQNTHSVVHAEADTYIDWIEESFNYPDGSTASLRSPEIEIRNLGYGEMHPDTLIGIRNAPPIHGAGLLEMIKQADLDTLADPQDKNADGISGRVNIVWDFDNNKPVPGRFGLKANKASVRFQVAGALNGDMGISSSVFPHQPCTEKQTACLNSIHGTDKNGHEISDKLLQLMIDFNLSLGVPERRKAEHPMVLAGRTHFYQLNCQSCHHPSYTTANSEKYPHLSEQTIWPYTDLLLHDMGNKLADNRPDYLASGTEWRTPPLWGVGLSEAVSGSKQYLHDGRARSVEEAILWHGGEAETIQQAFINLEKSQRQALIAFVKSL